MLTLLPFADNHMRREAEPLSQIHVGCGWADNGVLKKRESYVFGQLLLHNVIQLERLTGLVVRDNVE
jgi:hypothetical protein